MSDEVTLRILDLIRDLIKQPLFWVIICYLVLLFAAKEEPLTKILKIIFTEIRSVLEAPKPSRLGVNLIGGILVLLLYLASMDFSALHKLEQFVHGSTKSEPLPSITLGLFFLIYCLYWLISVWLAGKKK